MGVDVDVDVDGGATPSPLAGPAASFSISLLFVYFFFIFIHTLDANGKKMNQLPTMPVVARSLPTVYNLKSNVYYYQHT